MRQVIEESQVRSVDDGGNATNEAGMNRESRTLNVRARIGDTQGAGFNTEIRLSRSPDHLNTVLDVDGFEQHTTVSMKNDLALAAFFLDLDVKTLQNRLGEHQGSAKYVLSKLDWLDRYLDEGNVDDARRVISTLRDVFSEADE